MYYIWYHWKGLFVGALHPRNVWPYQEVYHLVRVCTRGDIYCATPLEIRYPTQSHYPDPQRTSPYPFEIMQSARLGSDT